MLSPTHTAIKRRCVKHIKHINHIVIGLIAALSDAHGCDVLFWQRQGEVMPEALTQEQRDTDLEAYFEEPVFEEKILSCWGIGPLEVCATKIAADRVDVDIKLAGVRIGHGSLTAANSRICASASVAIVKAKVCVRADFPGQTVWAEGEVCTRKFPSGWSCRGFKTKILAW